MIEPEPQNPRIAKIQKEIEEVNSDIDKLNQEIKEEQKQQEELDKKISSENYTRSYLKGCYEELEDKLAEHSRKLNERNNLEMMIMNTKKAIEALKLDSSENSSHLYGVFKQKQNEWEEALRLYEEKKQMYHENKAKFAHQLELSKPSIDLINLVEKLIPQINEAHKSLDRVKNHQEGVESKQGNALVKYFCTKCGKYPCEIYFLPCHHFSKYCNICLKYNYQERCYICEQDVIEIKEIRLYDQIPSFN